MARIYDDPKHPFYGPVRRLHVMLLQLTADVGYDAADAFYRRSLQPAGDWDADLAGYLGRSMTEALAQATILRPIVQALTTGKLRRA